MGDWTQEELTDLLNLLKEDTVYVAIAKSMLCIQIPSDFWQSEDERLDPNYCA